ncbi:hypothetical protein AB4Z55_16680 [Gordonia sp. ABKF26]|uniref:hypothetical protein n=1 Tax=Gordonia TaxID=2053 RepID=UPI0015DE5B68|nr:hypothetical protein [Gordonia terrae]
MPSDPSQDLDPTQWLSVHQALIDAGLVDFDEIEQVINAETEHAENSASGADRHGPIE